jgi:hypothetical protein
MTNIINKISVHLILSAILSRLESVTSYIGWQAPSPDRLTIIISELSAGKM